MKSQKTGGTSLELALSRFCGPGDVITPLNEKHERQRRGAVFSHDQNTVAGGYTRLHELIRCCL